MMNAMTTEPVTSVFPLYDILQSRLGGKTSLVGLSEDVQHELVEKIKKFDELGQELVYAIIRCFHLHNGHGTIMDVPYNMKKMKNGEYRLDMKNIPLELQYLLLEFVTIHENSSQSGLTTTK